MVLSQQNQPIVRRTSESARWNFQSTAQQAAHLFNNKNNNTGGGMECSNVSRTNETDSCVALVMVRLVQDQDRAIES